MRRVRLTEPATTEFAKWKTRAQKADQDVSDSIGNGEKPTFKNAIWADVKDVLINAFRGKCAYCEARFDHVSWGDVEHYRPKGKVTDENDEPVLLRNGDPHPGYYWLAYRFSNYMPSCQRCNQSNAKMNKFPVASFRATGPGEEALEEPLLLNPLTDDPENDLEFDPDLGTVTGKTASARISIGIYALLREELVEMRREAQASARLKIGVAIMSRNLPEAQKVVGRYRAGEEQFSAAVLATIRALMREVSTLLGP